MDGPEKFVRYLCKMETVVKRVKCLENAALLELMMSRVSGCWKFHELSRLPCSHDKIMALFTGGWHVCKV